MTTIEADPQDDAWDLYVAGWKVLKQGGRVREAESMLRTAAATGLPEASYGLGVALSYQRGRLAEEEAAFRAALGSDEPDYVCSAAMYLGELAHLRGDSEGARAAYALAERQEAPLSYQASCHLALLLAYAGDHDGARERFTSFAVWKGHQRDVDLTDGSADRLAQLFVGVAASRRTRVAWFQYVRARIWLSRLISARVANSRSATQWQSRITDRKSMLIERFWAW